MSYAYTRSSLVIGFHRLSWDTILIAVGISGVYLLLFSFFHDIEFCINKSDVYFCLWNCSSSFERKSVKIARISQFPIRFLAVLVPQTVCRWGSQCFLVCQCVRLVWNAVFIRCLSPMWFGMLCPHSWACLPSCLPCCFFQLVWDDLVWDAVVSWACLPACLRSCLPARFLLFFCLCLFFQSCVVYAVSPMVWVWFF